MAVDGASRGKHRLLPLRRRKGDSISALHDGNDLRRRTFACMAQRTCGRQGKNKKENLILNDKKEYYLILEKFGYFGVALYSALDKFPTLSMNSDNFIFPKN